jgi:hypothetical protein
MKDIRTQLPECPLEYEVPLIPGTHTALVIAINAADIDWQEKVLPWTLASLINNTDLIMKGVHLYIACEAGTQDRIRTALKRFALPHNTIIERDSTQPFITFGEHGFGYDSICMLDIHWWAFRGASGSGNPEIKLPLGHVLRYNYGWGVTDYSLHPVNDLRFKGPWALPALQLTELDSPESRQKLANYFREAGSRARWLHDANRAVYGENYEKKGKTVESYFLNVNGEPNWHLDASILQYRAFDVVDDRTMNWFAEWQHLGTDALIALHLLKTGTHAYNFLDSMMLEGCQAWNDFDTTANPVHMSYPRLCNMRFATLHGYRHAIHYLMGAELGITPRMPGDIKRIK